ncbi:Uncharacterised protein [Mycobacteroides abscessus subsp. abscessus]|nr:Uncharacterised protein [Mycobacteroides abscessus subsp. abscessus]
MVAPLPSMILYAACTTSCWMRSRAGASMAWPPGRGFHSSSGTPPIDAELHSGISESPCSPTM